MAGGGLGADPTSADSLNRTYTQWQLVRRMLGLSWRYRWGCIKVAALHLSLRLLEIGGLGGFGLGLDFVRHRLQTDAPPPPWPLGLTPPASWTTMQVIWVIGLFVGAMAMLRAVMTYFTVTSTADLVNRQIVVHLRSQVYDKMQRLSFRFFDANESGSLINRVTADVQRVRMFIEMVVVQVLILVVSLVTYLTYMAGVHVTLTLGCLATTPLLWIATAWFSKRVKPAYRESRRLMDRAILRLSENLQGVHVVKGFSLQQRQSERFAESNDAVTDQRRWIFSQHGLFVPAIHVLTQLNLVVLLALGGYFVFQGSLTIGSMLVFAGLLQQFSQQVGNIANIANSMQEALVGAQRVFEVLDEPTEIQSKPDAAPLPRPRGEVVFEHVAFSYDDGEPVLEDVSLQASPDECVAILGATGSGKSTLLSMIPRFYDPTRGRVLIDGIDARDIELDDLRRSVGLVFQESFLFSNTIAANIAFGHPEATPEQIERAARIACAHGFIMELPDGYETVLGESGKSLSGGQRQRLAIARAILLEPAILVLDDPTAAIDPETEGEILEAMDHAMEGRTTFVVAHRLSTLRRAHKVVVLDKGRIVQSGTHDELMSAGGHYRWAADLQTGDPEDRRLLGMDAGGGET